MQLQTKDEELKDVLLYELSEIAEGAPFIPSLTCVDIAFNSKLTSLSSLSRVHNLIQLSLVYCCEIFNLEAIGTQGHSLETLHVVGCSLASMAWCSKLVNLRQVNLGENKLKQIEGLER
jgi:Leucine-rich repeat (LRR) protein